MLCTSCDISFSDVLYLTTNKKQKLFHTIRMFICSYERDKGCVCGRHRCRMEDRLYIEVPPKKMVPIIINRLEVYGKR